MREYCGIDLHATSCWIVILDEGFRLVRERKVANNLEEVLAVLEGDRDALEGIAVESTFNWYWLVDGLQDAGYRVHLTNTWAVQQYEGLKYTDDRHDARWLAHLLALGILPEGHIYPKGERPLRDLLRRRAFLVRKKTSMLLSMHGALECRTGVRVKANDLKRWSVEDVEAQLKDPTVSLGITCLLKPMQALSEQIRAIEKTVMSRAKLREEFTLLQTVWGIGPVLALTIMYEVGPIARFATVGHFASYCRCVKTDRLSNGKRKGSGNRRNGNPYLSWAFSEVAHYAARFHPTAQRYFQRKRAATNGIIANRALAHKLARASYYVLRDQVPFNPDRLFA
jgi:transposase